MTVTLITKKISDTYLSSKKLINRNLFPKPSNDKVGSDSCDEFLRTK